MRPNHRLLTEGPEPVNSFNSFKEENSNNNLIDGNMVMTDRNNINRLGIS